MLAFCRCIMANANSTFGPEEALKPGTLPGVIAVGKSTLLDCSWTDETPNYPPTLLVSGWKCHTGEEDDGVTIMQMTTGLWENLRGLSRVASRVEQVATCNMEFPTCYMKFSTCNMQHEICNMQQKNCKIHMKFASCNIKFAVCNMKFATCKMKFELAR